MAASAGVVVVSTVREAECDGCGKRAPMRGVSLPFGWRSVNIGRPGGGSWHRDICGPSCASRAVDSTYEDEDRAELELLERHGPRLARIDGNAV